jgi:signal transduction histidine kinase
MVLLVSSVKRITSDPALIQPSELANEEIARLSGLLNEFLAFARAPELRASHHNVIALAHQVIDLEHPFAERQKIELTVTPSTGELDANVDPGKLHQIIQNLVRNALEATPSGGRVEVELAIASDRALHVRVRDDGGGMTEETKRRVFEPFFSTKDTGTGMGMAIVHSFVTMHGGTVDIVSSAKGTLVDVALPQPGPSILTAKA